LSTSGSIGQGLLTSSSLGVVLDSKSLAVEGIVGSTAQLLLHLVLGSISAAGNSLAESGGNARGCETALEEHCVEYWGVESVVVLVLVILQECRRLIQCETEDRRFLASSLPYLR
jgi:hypothetical protein